MRPSHPPQAGGRRPRRGHSYPGSGSGPGLTTTIGPTEYVRTLFSSKALFAISALFVIYGTTIPWDFTRAPTLSDASFIPLWDADRGRIHSIPDLVQNVAFFMPFGFFGVMALPSLRGTGLRGAIKIAIAGLCLSLFAESLQTMSPLRQTSASDVVTNTFGALIGGVAGSYYVTRLHVRVASAVDYGLRESPGMLIVAGYFLAVVAALLAPFIPTLDLGHFAQGVKAVISNPLGDKSIASLAFTATLFAGFAFVCASEVASYAARNGWLRIHPHAIPREVGATVAATIVPIVAIALESAQLFMVHHVPGGRELIANVTGALVGAFAVTFVGQGHLRPAVSLGDQTRRTPKLVLGFAIALPALRALAPLEFRSFAEGTAQLSWQSFLPFWSLISNLTMSTFTNIFEAAATYVPLGYAIRALGRFPTSAFIWAVVVAETLEVAQIFVAGRTVDITEGLLAAVGALLGALAIEMLELRRRLV